MKLLTVAQMVIWVSEVDALENSESISDLMDRQKNLSQSFPSPFQIQPPKIITTKPLPGAGTTKCPARAVELTFASSGGAILDGCCMNTMRKTARNELTGEEVQH